MRTLRHFVLPFVAGTFLLFSAAPIPAQTLREPTDLDRRFARHFPERPPVQFEIAEDADHRPLTIVTNSYQFSLTAYAVRMEPKLAGDSPQTSICDALTRMCGLRPIPRGLSHKMGVPHLVGGPVPDSSLVAAVWEDGSTFGPDELLARISASRKAMVDSYDLAIVALQTGLEKNWTVEEYLAAARPPNPPMPARMMATKDEASAATEKLTAQRLPSLTITDNMQHAIEHDRSPARVAKLAQILLKDFEQSRDALRKALGGPTAFGDQTPNR